MFCASLNRERLGDFPATRDIRTKSSNVRKLKYHTFGLRAALNSPGDNKEKNTPYKKVINPKSVLLPPRNFFSLGVEVTFLQGTKGNIFITFQILK